jgi:hypothetical protein
MSALGLTRKYIQFVSRVQINGVSAFKHILTVSLLRMAFGERHMAILRWQCTLSKRAQLTGLELTGTGCGALRACLCELLKH